MCDPKEGAEDLETLLARVRACRVCREVEGARRLPHEPRPVLRVSATARLFVLSQAPGARVHATGLPFNDASGARLRSWMGVSEEEFYDSTKIAFVPMGFCFPGTDRHGGDLPPRKECAPLWRERIFQALPKPPELMLLVGSYAQRWHLGPRACQSLDQTLKNWRAYLDAEGQTRILPLPHPSWRNTAWLKRNPWFESEVVPRVRAEVARLIR